MIALDNGRLEEGRRNAGATHPCTRGRTESCTLRILKDAFTGAHEKEGREFSAGGAGALWITVD